MLHEIKVVSRENFNNFLILIDPSQHALLKRLTDHIDINYFVPTEMVKSIKGEKETEQCSEELSDTESQTLDLMLLKFLSFLHCSLICNTQTRRPDGLDLICRF